MDGHGETDRDGEGEVVAAIAEERREGRRVLDRGRDNDWVEAEAGNGDEGLSDVRSRRRRTTYGAPFASTISQVCWNGPNSDDDEVQFDRARSPTVPPATDPPDDRDVNEDAGEVEK